MHLEPDVVAGTVNEIFVVTLGTNVVHRRAMDSSKRCPWSHLGDCGLLSIQYNLIDLSLACCELTGNRICSCHVCAIAAIFRAHVHHNDVTSLHTSRILVIVEDCRKWPRTNDRWITRTLRTIPPEFKLDRSFDFVLHDPRGDCLSCSLLRF